MYSPQIVPSISDIAHDVLLVGGTILLIAVTVAVIRMLWKLVDYAFEGPAERKERRATRKREEEARDRRRERYFFAREYRESHSRPYRGRRR